MELTTNSRSTELGTLPLEWSVRTLRELGKVHDGTHQTPRYVSDGVPFYSVEHVTSGDFSNTKFISPEEHRFLTRTFKMERGDVLMTRIGSIGECRLIDWEVDASFYVSLALLKLRDIDAGYFTQYSNSPMFKQEVELHSLPSAVPRKINLGPISDIRVAVPPIEEQRAIATALSDVDALIAGLERLIAKKRDIKQAAMQQLLTGQTRLPGFSGEWDRAELKRLVSTPITDGPHMTPKFHDAGVPFLSVNNLVDNRIDLTDLRYISKEDDLVFARKCKPKVGDVLLGKAASVGKVAIVEEDFDFNIWSPIALVRTGDAINAKFLYYQLLSADCAGQIALLTNSSSQGNIGMGDIERLQISYPGPDEQTAIATVLSDMDADLTALESRLAKTRAIKQGMMQELLTGRTRLV